MEDISINYSAVIVAVVVNFIFGFIWYTPVFGKAWAVEMGMDPEAVCFHGKGCEECGDTGYRGRQGLYEVLPITANMRELILDRASTAELREAAIDPEVTTYPLEDANRALLDLKHRPVRGAKVLVMD